MNIAGVIYKELAKLGLSNMDLIDFQEIRNKDGVYLYRVIYDNKFYVLKYFLNDEYTREIENYSILKELNIPTVEVFGYTDRALLLEDIEKSKKYRLGVQSDLSNIEVAKALAKWYIKLHNEGEKYILGKDSKFYRETDVITKENIELIKNKSNTGDNKVWYLIIDNLDLIFRRIKDLGETMTYNDFYCTNLAVSNDKREAIMFDYNLLGIGFKYNDIRNVCSSLSEEAGKVFIEAYGGINQREKTVDDGISILVNLIFAYQRPMFPNWAQDSLGAIYNGKLEKAIKRILEVS
ncbi:MAG: hypothetical protein ACLKAM_09420 [Alkaliphilus sp.]